MNAEQLRDLAARLERSTPPPRQEQQEHDYMMNRLTHDMARHLRDMAVDISPDRLCRKHSPDGREICWLKAGHPVPHSWEREALTQTEREADRNADAARVPLLTDTVREALAKVWDAGHRAASPTNPYRGAT